MTVYGITRTSNKAHSLSPEGQEEAIKKYAAENGLDEPIVLHEKRGTSGWLTKFRNRQQGHWLLRNLKPGDTLVVTRLDRLGRNTSDVLWTIDRLAKRDVRIVVIQFLGLQSLDLISPVGKLMMTVFAAFAEFEHEMAVERRQEALAKKMATGLYCPQPGYGKKKVTDENGCHWEWDLDQLGYIAEIAERLGEGEPVERIVIDYWRRAIRDHRGNLWGLRKPKPGKGTGRQTEHFWRAARWFHRAKHAGKLPPPYCEIAATIPEYRSFRVEPQPKRVKPKVDEKLTWTAEQWREFYLTEWGP